MQHGTCLLCPQVCLLTRLPSNVLPKLISQRVETAQADQAVIFCISVSRGAMISSAGMHDDPRLTVSVTAWMLSMVGTAVFSVLLRVVCPYVKRVCELAQQLHHNGKHNGYTETQ